MPTEPNINEAHEEVDHGRDETSELTLVYKTWGTIRLLTFNRLRPGLALAGAAMAYFTTVGFLNAFGIFQEYYASTVLRGRSNFEISWVSQGH